MDGLYGKLYWNHDLGVPPFKETSIWGWCHMNDPWDFGDDLDLRSKTTDQPTTPLSKEDKERCVKTCLLVVEICTQAYCWWFRNPKANHRLDVFNLWYIVLYNRINYQPELVFAGLMIIFFKWVGSTTNYVKLSRVQKQVTTVSTTPQVVATSRYLCHELGH